MANNKLLQSYRLQEFFYDERRIKQNVKVFFGKREENFIFRAAEYP